MDHPSQQVGRRPLVIQGNGLIQVRHGPGRITKFIASFCPIEIGINKVTLGSNRSIEGLQCRSIVLEGHLRQPLPQQSLRHLGIVSQGLLKPSDRLAVAFVVQFLNPAIVKFHRLHCHSQLLFDRRQVRSIGG